MKTGEWMVKNSIKQNEKRVVMLLEKYGFDVGIGTNCQISINGRNDDYDIYLSYGTKNYRIEIDKNSRVFNLLGECLARNPSKKPKYHMVKSFNSLYEVLDFIKGNTTYRLVS